MRYPQLSQWHLPFGALWPMHSRKCRLITSGSHCSKILWHRFKIFGDIFPNSRTTIMSDITFTVDRVSLISIDHSSLRSNQCAWNWRRGRQLSLAWRLALCWIVQQEGARMCNSASVCKACIGLDCVSVVCLHCFTVSAQNGKAIQQARSKPL
jgi:hypothetical protein